MIQSLPTLQSHSAQSRTAIENTEQQVISSSRFENLKIRKGLFNFVKAFLILQTQLLFASRRPNLGRAPLRIWNARILYKLQCIIYFIYCAA